MTTQKTRTLVIATILAALVAGCTSGAAETADTETGQSVSAPEGDTSALTPVEPFTVLTFTAADDPSRFEQGRLIVEAWQEAGIPAELEPVSSAVISERGFASKDFDVYLISYDPTTDRLDPDNFLARFWGETAVDDGSNLSGYDNPDYNELYLSQLSAGDQDERLAHVLEMQELLYEHQPAGVFLHLLIGGAYRSDAWTNFTKSVGTPVYHIWNSIGLTPTDADDPLIVGITSEAQTLNPVTAATSEAGIPLSHIYDSLLRIGPDGELVNWAASDYAIDESTVTLSLRDDLQFHDGEPVTADDVAFTFEYLVEHEAPLYASRLASVDDIAVDGDQVEITLTEPNASFDTTALAQVPILPEHIWSEIEDPTGFANEEPVGSGPFAFESRALGADLRLTAVEDHFSDPQPSGIVWVVFGSLDAEIGALETGEIDMLGDFVSLSQLSSLTGVEGVTVESNPSHGANMLHYNMRREPLDDRHFRRALSHLIPTQDIIEIVFEGEGEPASSVIATPIWTHPDLTPLPFDPDHARIELETAGYVFGEDGTLYYPPADGDNRVYDNEE